MQVPRLPIPPATLIPNSQRTQSLCRVPHTFLESWLYGTKPPLRHNCHPNYLALLPAKDRNRSATHDLHPGRCAPLHLVRRTSRVWRLLFEGENFCGLNNCARTGRRLSPSRSPPPCRVAKQTVTGGLAGGDPPGDWQLTRQGRRWLPPVDGEARHQLERP